MNYTSIEQSKKLLELGISHESADMFHLRIVGETYDKYGELIPLEDNLCKVEVDSPNRLDYPEDDMLPCWGLAALLDVLPNNETISTNISRGSWKIDTAEYLPNTWWCEYEDTKTETEFNISADNPVDACYKMIIKLHELKML